jgi:hypothetical protein
MTYAMMLIAAQSFQRAGDEPIEYRGRIPHMLAEYRRLTAQCLILADVTQPIDNMLETLILYSLSDYGRSPDAEFSILIGVSVIVRLAMRQGYHRDSKDFPAISPFKGEVCNLMRGVDSVPEANVSNRCVGEYGLSFGRLTFSSPHKQAYLQWSDLPTLILRLL